MTFEEEKNDLEAYGYTDITDVPGKGICAILLGMFEVVLCYDLDKNLYEGGMYSFLTPEEAQESLKKWDGKNDPPGNWIKHKGKTEYSNPNYNNEV